MSKFSRQSNDRELFDSFFAELVDDIVKENENCEETADAARHMREVKPQMYLQNCMHHYIVTKQLLELK